MAGWEESREEILGQGLRDRDWGGGGTGGEMTGPRQTEKLNSHLHPHSNSYLGLQLSTLLPAPHLQSQPPTALEKRVLEGVLAPTGRGVCGESPRVFGHAELIPPMREKVHGGDGVWGLGKGKDREMQGRHWSKTC